MAVDRRLICVISERRYSLPQQTSPVSTPPSSPRVPEDLATISRRCSQASTLIDDPIAEIFAAVRKRRLQKVQALLSGDNADILVSVPQKGRTLVDCVMEGNPCPETQIPLLELLQSKGVRFSLVHDKVLARRFRDYNVYIQHKNGAVAVPPPRKRVRTWKIPTW